jgi:hypothetical protein
MKKTSASSLIEALRAGPMPERMTLDNAAKRGLWHTAKRQLQFKLKLRLLPRLRMKKGAEAPFNRVSED